MMKLALYSPYLDTLGGGERYLATIAEGLAGGGDEVSFFWDDPAIIANLEERFHLNLAKVKTQPNIFAKRPNLIVRWNILHRFDFAIYLSDGSIPAPLAKNNILHFQVPFILKNGRKLLNRIKLTHYKAVVANSYFTKSHIDRTYDVLAKVIYPPVDLSFFKSGKKENIILSVGRFSQVFGGKKQELLIEVFGKFHRQYPNFELVLAGGIQDKKLLTKLRTKAKKLPIKIVSDVSADNLQKLYTSAKIYWHATGFGEDLQRFPQHAEHFGISVVEAMAAGAVPVVFAGGGLVEIVDQGKNGFLWKTKAELLVQTETLIKDEKLYQKMARSAQAKAAKFSKDRFISEFTKILS